MGEDLRKLQHKPIQPPRKGHLGEQVYASMWEAFMTRPPAESWDAPSPIEEVMWNSLQQITQRHASVLASVVCWLGTNCGNCMLQQAEKEREAERWDADKCYLLSWTLQNRRRLGVNSGVRTIETLLAPPDTVVRTMRLGEPHLKVQPALSAEDLEAVDHLMLWLAEPAGRAFVTQCEAEIRRLQDEHELAKRAAHLRENFPTTAAPGSALT